MIPMYISPETQRQIKLLMDIGGLILLPFLGILSYFKERVLPYIVTFCIIWFIAGMLIIGGGVTPIGHGDVVTREDRTIWFNSPFVEYINGVWIAGLLLGIFLVIATWAYENKTLSKPVKLIIKIIKLVGFPIGIWKFFDLYYFR
jgi:hypothetical protein